MPDPTDVEACDHALSGEEFILDVHTHHVIPDGPWRAEAPAIESMIRDVIPYVCEAADPFECLFGESYVRDLFLACDTTVSILSDVGPLPGWVVRPEGGSAGGDWAVLVHGRGARREETLRAVPVLWAAGWTSLVASYRNDRDAPRGPDGRYNLGLSEWRDVEAAMGYAVSHGARRIVLVGWSMGGAVVLQALDRSPLAERVVGVCLDSAVLDWGVVLRHHAHLHRVPGPLARMATDLMGSRGSRRLVGVHEPIDVARTDWVARADELTRPMLVIHSDGDDFVPIGPAVALAGRRPDLVRFERWQLARHCREWNDDPQRWEQALSDFLSAV